MGTEVVIIVVVDSHIQHLVLATKHYSRRRWLPSEDEGNR